MQTPLFINAPTLPSLLENAVHRSELTGALSAFLEGQRWFAAKTEGIQSIDILDSVSIPAGPTSFELVLAAITTNGGTNDCYALPMAIIAGASSVLSNSTIALLAGEDGSSTQPASLIECSGDAEFWRAITTALVDASLTTRNGRTLKLSQTSAAQFGNAASLRDSEFTVHGGEQSNSAVAIGDDFFLKLFRRPRVGHNPDAEVGIFLTERTTFSNSPRVEATIDILGPDGQRCLALISEQVQADTDAWTFTLDSLKRFWHRLAALDKRPEIPPRIGDATGEDSTPVGMPELTVELIGKFSRDIAQLGRRTAELHSALSSGDDDPAFAPEPLTRESWSKLIHQIRSEVQSTCKLLEQAARTTRVAADLPGRIATRANTLLDKMTTFDPVQANVVNIRCHGDYHLGQVLRTESDFIIIDFEGEPDRPFEERRQKRCAMKDVAGMIRSLHYASCAASVGLLPAPAPSISNPRLWQKFWFESVKATFLAGYELAAAEQPFLPADGHSFQQLLDLFLIEKVLYEIRYEINNRPDWVQIPLAGLTSVLGIAQ